MRLMISTADTSAITDVLLTELRNTRKTPRTYILSEISKLGFPRDLAQTLCNAMGIVPAVKHITRGLWDYTFTAIKLLKRSRFASSYEAHCWNQLLSSEWLQLYFNLQRQGLSVARLLLRGKLNWCLICCGTVQHESFINSCLKNSVIGNVFRSAVSKVEYNH